MAAVAVAAMPVSTYSSDEIDGEHHGSSGNDECDKNRHVFAPASDPLDV